MKVLLFALLALGSIAVSSGIILSATQPSASISSADPDFSIVLFPDTQYYSGQNSYVFRDQANWVVANRSRLNIKMVIGMGDIIDGGGYPIDGHGNVSGTCAKAPPSTWQTQWQHAQAAVNILTNHGMYYQPTIGNHDYDCEADRPQPRGTTNYFHYFGTGTVHPTAYILDESGNRTPNFYKIMTIGSTSYMILSLELFPRGSILSAANKLISNFSGPVIVATHAYLSNPYRPIQILSDFQGQGHNGFFGYGYLRILTVSPSKKTVTVFTYSPSIANSPGMFPAGIPAYKTDPHNQYTLNFPNTFGGPDREVTHITNPFDGSHVPLTFGISAAAFGPDNASHMQIYVDGTRQADYLNASALPSATTVTLPGAGVHRVA